MRKVLLLIAMAALVSGCGPVWAQKVISEATGKLNAAETADAEKYSPYEYYCAGEYLHQARYKESYSQFERAVDYGKLALEFATTALEKSQVAKGLSPQPPPAAPAVNKAGPPQGKK
ncbi:MAG: DUF4398 domain-containing protein [Myxococcota bacterium]